MEKFKAVLELQNKYHSVLGYGLVTLLTVGGEKLFSQVVFQCPCNATWNLPYGLVFLLVPALALFLLGYALNTRTWRLLTGCCCTGSASSSSGSHSALTCLQINLAAALAPLTWVAVALLGGSFYQCAVSGSAPMAKYLCGNLDSSCAIKLPKVPCNGQEEEMQDILNQLKAQSQVNMEITWKGRGGIHPGAGAVGARIEHLDWYLLHCSLVFSPAGQQILRPGEFAQSGRN